MPSPLKNYQAFVFDMDGVLIDSEPLWRQAEMLVLNNFGVGLTDDMCKQTMGLRLDEMVEYWYDRYPWPNKSCADVAILILIEVTKLVESSGRALPGAIPLIRRLKEQQCQLAVASSSPRSLINCVLTKLDLGDCFSVIASAENQEYGKPHPGVYLAAAKELKVDPENCLAFEDSLNGVKSALAAGMTVVGIPEKGAFLEFPLSVKRMANLNEASQWLMA